MLHNWSWSSVLYSFNIIVLYVCLHVIGHSVSKKSNYVFRISLLNYHVMWGCGWCEKMESWGKPETSHPPPPPPLEREEALNLSVWNLSVCLAPLKAGKFRFLDLSPFPHLLCWLSELISNLESNEQIFISIFLGLKRREEGPNGGWRGKCVF